MKKHLSINGKKYLPSIDLAVTSGYTTDHIAKLAREEKIIGTQIGIQWFIEPESLQLFLYKTTVEKEIRKFDLKQTRKIEHALSRKTVSLEVNSGKSKKKHLAVSALVQSFVIVVCGISIGGLSWFITTENLENRESLVAASSESVVPASVSVEEKSVKLPPVEIFASLPSFPEREVLVDLTASSSATSSSTAERIDFSDAVEVVVREDGSQWIQPVFRDDAGEGFLLVPVKETRN